MSHWYDSLCMLSLCLFGLWGCAHKPTNSPPEVIIPGGSTGNQLPPLPKPEPGLESDQVQPKLLFDPYEPEIDAKLILAGLEEAELPETGVCVFWNALRGKEESRHVFLLEKSGSTAQMHALRIVEEDVPKTRKAFAGRSAPVPGKAGNKGWRMLCKQMELHIPKGQAI